MITHIAPPTRAPNAAVAALVPAVPAVRRGQGIRSVCPQTITVTSGETLWWLAGNCYGSANTARWWDIYQASRSVIGADPNLIIPGEVLHVPAAITAIAPALPSSPAPSPPAPAPSGHAPPAPPVPVSDTLPPPSPGQSAPWSIFSQPGGQHIAVSYAAALLKAIGAPITPGNLQVVYDWEVSEGSGGLYNPLNGGDFGGLAISGQQFGGGANDYPSLGVSVRAMAGILLYDQGFGYDHVVSALRADDPSAARNAIWTSEWAASHYEWGGSWSSAPLP